MNSFRVLLFLTAALVGGFARLGAAAGPSFVYETPGEFIAAGDFNGDGVADILVLDKATGNARVGYSGAGGSLLWSSPLSTGLQNPTGCAVGRFQRTACDTVAVTAPAFNCVNLVDLSQTNTAGTPAVVTPLGIGPHMVLPLANAAGGVPPAYQSLLIASSQNSANAEDLDLMSLNAGVGAEAGQYQEGGPYDRGNALQLSGTPPTLAVGLVRGATNDTLDVWQFTNSPAVMLSVSNLVSGGDYAFGLFNQQTLPWFIFYQPGGTNLTLAQLITANGGLAFGASQTCSVTEPIAGVYYLDLTGAGNGEAMILFTNGVEGLSLTGGVPAFSSLYTAGAASGDSFTGIAPLSAGQFVLLDGPPGSLSSVHAQVIHFDGTTFTQLSSGYLPSTTTRNTRANVWLFQSEPFVNRSPGLIAATNSPDWTAIVTNLPGSIAVTHETDNGTNAGLGSTAAVNLGTAPNGSVFGLANQYSPAISLFSYGGTQGAQPVNVTISPPPGSYTAPLAITFATLNPSDQVNYRIVGSGNWQTYAGSFFLTNDCTVEYYGMNAAQPLRSQLQTATYSLNNNNQLAQQGASQASASGGATTPYQLPPVLYNSDSGTLFYGRRSTANAGTVWAIHMDGSDDTYITNGVRPRASHDGRWLAFMREGQPFNNQGNLWIRNLLTGLEQRLLVNTNKIVGYDWEPDDSGLVLDYGGSIWKLGMNGALTLLVQSDGFAGAPVLNPVDTGLAYHDLALNARSGNPGLFNDPFAGIAPPWVPPWQIVTDIPGASWPEWSPDGKTLCFADDNSLQSVDDGTNLWLVAADGSTLNRVCDFTGTGNRFPHGALWTLDGGSLVGAATMYASNGLWVITLNADHTDCAGDAAVRLPTTPGDAIDFAGSVVPSTGFYENAGGNVLTSSPAPAPITNYGDYVFSLPLNLTNLYQFSGLSPNDWGTVYGLAVDQAGGYVYLSDNGSIFQYNFNAYDGLKRVEGPIPGSLSVNDFEPNGYLGYDGLATDRQGDLFFTDQQNDYICELTAGQMAAGITNAVIVTDTNYNFELYETVPLSLGVDGAGDVFLDNFASYGGSSIVELPSSGASYGHPFYLPGRPDTMSSMTLDPAGNVYGLDDNSNLVYRYSPGSGWKQFVALPDFNILPTALPNGMAVDGGGDLYMGLQGRGLWTWLPAANTFFNWWGQEADAVSPDAQGDIFISSYNSLYELQPAMVDTAPFPVPVTGGSFSLPPIVNLRSGASSVNLSGPFTPTCSNPDISLTVGPWGVISFTCPPNNRTNAVTETYTVNVLGRYVPIVQAGNIYTLAADSAVELPAAVSDSVGLIVSPTNGIWTASAYYNSDWITVNTAQGTGSGKVRFSFSANYGSTRTGTIVIANQYFSVTQMGAGYASASAPGTLIPSLVAPNGVAVDGAGDVYVADRGSKTVKEWLAANGNVVTVVSSGLADPAGVAVDGSGNLYIADGLGGTIYELPAGSPLPAGSSELVTLVSGLGDAAGVAVDGSGDVFYTDSANNLAGKYNATAGAKILVAFGLNGPTGLAVDIYGNVFIADTGDHAIKEWAAGGGLTTVVASGLDEPTGVAVDTAGDLFIADTGASAIYELPVGGSLTYLADDPNDIAVGSTGNLYFSDGAFGAVEEIETAEVNTTGRYETANAGSDSLPPIIPSTVNLTGPFAPTSDSPWLEIANVNAGVVTFSFTANFGVSRTAHITVLGQTIAVTQGAPSFTLGTTNLFEGPAAGLDSVIAVALPALAPWTASSTASWLHVPGNGPGTTNVVFRFDANPAGTRTGTLIIGGETLTVTQAGSTYVATAAGGYVSNLVTGLEYPDNVAVDGRGNVYIASANTFSIDEWSVTNGVVSPIASLYDPAYSVTLDAAGDVYYVENGAVYEQNANGEDLNYVYFGGYTAAVAVDSAGNIYVTEPQNNLVEEWSASSGLITTLVSTNLNQPYGLAVDAAGDVYIADTDNNVVKEWSPISQTVTTLVASGLSDPEGLAVDGGGNVYIADSGDAEIKEWSPATGLVTTLVPNTAGLNFPRGVAVDSSGNLYVADYGNGQIAELPRAFVDPSPRMESAAGGTDSLPVVLPATENLGGIFAPVSDAAWLAITGTNNGVVAFSFAPNTTAGSPSAQITLFGQVINITQSGPHSLSTSTRVEGPAGGNDSVILATGSAYPDWTATANNPWLHVSPGSQSGSGNATIFFSCDPNYGSTQTGTITIGGVTLNVIQAGNNYAAATLVTNIVSTGLNSPEGVAVDGAGNVFIADTGNAAIKEWSPGCNTVTNLVTSGLSSPQGVAVDGADTVYIADPAENAVFQWSPTNNALTTLAEGYIPSVGGFVQPTGVAVDTAGNVFFADSFHDAIDEWTVADGNVASVVSSGLNSPQGVAVDYADNLYIADLYNYAVEKYTPGSGQLTPLVPSVWAQGVAVDVAGNAYAATYYDNSIEEWSAANNSVSTVAATGGLNLPQGVAVDGAGNIYIADTGHNAIQEAPYAFISTSAMYEGPAAGSDELPAVVPATANLSGAFTPTSDSPWLTVNGVLNGVVSYSFAANNGPPRTANLTVLGQNVIVSQSSPNTYALGGGSTEGPAAGSDTIVLGVYPNTGLWTATNIYQAPWLHLSPASQNGIGSTNLVFSCDANPGPTRSTELVIAGNYYQVVQAGSAYVAADPVTTLVPAGLSAPAGVAVDGRGNVYFADTGNNAIKEWNPTNNTVTTVLVTGLNHPAGVAVDYAGDLYIADSGDAAIKYWSATTSNLTTLVSSGLVNPQGVALDEFGELYISDSGNNSVFEVPYYGGSLGSPLVAAGLNGPRGVAVDYAGNLYIASSSNNTIFKWTAATSNLTSLVSTGLSQPNGVAVDPAGNVYIADGGHNAVKKWSALSNAVVNLATSGLTGPAGVAVDGDGSIYIADTGDNTIKERPNALVDTAPRWETGAAGSDVLPVVLPTYPLSLSLTAPFAPTSDQSWLTLGGSASGVVNFAFTANIGSSRTGHLTVLGQPVPVIQSGPSYTLGTTNRLDSPVAGSDSVVLAVVPNIATWTATANASWLHLSAGNGSGTGSTNVIYSYDANPGGTRTGTLTIAGQTLSVTQAGSTYVAASLLTNIVVESDPTGVAVDGSGNVFFAFPNGVYKWTPTNNTVNYDFGYPGVTAAAVDPAGDIYWASPSYAEVAEYSVSNVWSWVDYQNLVMPAGVAVDGSGNVYIADTGNAAIKEWSAASGNVATLITTGLTSPTGVAVDAADNLYIADSGAGKIFKWTLATGQFTTLIASGLSTPNGLAVDGSGNVYIADTGHNLIKEWSAASNTVSTLDSAGLSAPAGVAVDATGNVYIADTGNNAVKELARAFVDPTAKSEAPAAGGDSLPVVLPATENLNGPFAPSSDQAWLTPTSTNAGVVSFRFTAAATNRTAHLALLGQSISVVQTGSGAPFVAAKILANGGLQLSFTGGTTNTYTVLGTTNLALPLARWTLLGTASGNGSGSFQFTAPAVTNYPQQYFIITSQ